jgi:hypothetical protein
MVRQTGIRSGRKLVGSLKDATKRIVDEIRGVGLEACVGVVVNLSLGSVIT